MVMELLLTKTKYKFNISYNFVLGNVMKVFLVFFSTSRFSIHSFKEREAFNELMNLIEAFNVMKLFLNCNT